MLQKEAGGPPSICTDIKNNFRISGQGIKIQGQDPAQTLGTHSANVNPETIERNP